MIQCNEALSRLTEMSQEDLLGKDPAGLFDDVGDLSMLLARGTGQNGVRARCGHLNGSPRSVVLHIVPLGEPSGDAAAFCLLQAHDCVANADVERALRESERRAQDIVDNVEALVYIKRLDGKFALMNRHFQLRYGARREDLGRKTTADYFPEPIAQIYGENDRKVLAAGTAMTFEEPLPDGGAWLSLKFPLFDEDGTIYSIAGISTDISERWRAEAAIKAARDEAERANSAKSEFLSRMSHELRTPLNCILGFGQLLLTSELAAGAVQNVNGIVDAGRHLLELINEVLEISDVELGGRGAAVEPVHSCDPLADALKMVAPLAAERDIQIERDFHGGLHQFVLADYRRLRQVLLNLLTNAVNYNCDGGFISVSFSQPEIGLLRYRIGDTGYGIDQSEADKLFRPFERLGTSGDDRKGTGLGLAVSKAFVEAMQGRIGIEHSSREDGTVFFVDLRLAGPADPSAVSRPGGEPRDDTMRWDCSGAVLCIEDDTASLALVEQVLSRVSDITLISARYGAAGIELATARLPDVILLDLHLPDMGGLEVLERLRRNEATRRIPVIVLSADATREQRRRLLAAGADSYMTKPIEIGMLLEVVQHELGSAVTR